MSYYSGLHKAINSSIGERPILKYLKNHAYPLTYWFDHGWHFHLCVSEFQFGNDYRADFVILGAHSGACYASFLELESPSSRLYLKDGTHSKPLRTALRQISDWQEWIRQNPDGLRKCLKKAVKLLMDSEPTEDSKDAFGRLSSPDCYIQPNYHVVIGRRSQLTSEEQRRRSIEPLYSNGVQIATYDRLLQIAQLADIRERRTHKK